jgi:hypothetical protein
MRASKYPLESCGCPLPFWHSTPCQISDWIAQDFNLLTAARSQDWMDVVIRISLFRGDAFGLILATRYGAFKHYAPTHNLITTIKSSLWWFLIVITFPGKMLNQIALLANSFSLWPLNENRQLRLMKPHHWGRLLVHYHETLQVTLLFETLPSYRFERAITRLFDGMVRFCQSWARVKVPMIVVLLSITFKGLS